MFNAQEIRDEIVDYLVASDIAFSDWYVGIASDPVTRLFTDHNVDKEAYWIYKDAGSEECARAIGEFIINKHKTKGKSSVEDSATGYKTAQHVYAYAITGTTKQPAMDKRNVSRRGK